MGQSSSSAHPRLRRRRGLAGPAHRQDDDHPAAALQLEAVAAITVRVVADHIDDARLEGLYRIGVDEVSYRKGHRYLTVVADHDRDGAVVWVGEGKSGATLEASSTPSAPSAARNCRRRRWTCMAPTKVTRARAPRPGSAPIRSTSSSWPTPPSTRPAAAWNKARRAAGIPAPAGAGSAVPAAQLVKHTRWALLKDPATLTDHQRACSTSCAAPDTCCSAPGHSKRSSATSTGSRRPPAPTPTSTPGSPAPAAAASPPSSDLSRTIRAHRDEILAAVDLGLSNSKLEGLNSKIRLINHRGYGHHSAAAVTAMIYLCCSGLTITLPTQR